MIFGGKLDENIFFNFGSNNTFAGVSFSRLEHEKRYARKFQKADRWKNILWQK